MNRAELTQLGNDFVLETIDNTDGISFIEFKNSDELRKRLAPPITINIKPWIQLGSTKSYDEDEVSNWLLSLVKSEEIHGKVIMLWEDYKSRGLPERSEVILSENYNWVVPLWKRGHGLSIYSFDRGYAWNATIFEDSYAFFQIELKEYRSEY